MLLLAIKKAKNAADEIGGVLVVAAILCVAKGSGRKAGRSRIGPLLLFRRAPPDEDVIFMAVACGVVRIEPSGY